MSTSTLICIVAVHTRRLKSGIILGAHQQIGGREIEHPRVMEYYSIIKRNE